MELLGRAGGNVRVANPFSTPAVVRSANQETLDIPSGTKVIMFATRAGRTYQIAPPDSRPQEISITAQPNNEPKALLPTKQRWIGLP